MLQNQGIYLSMSSVYHHLKSLNQVEPYERRPSPLKGTKVPYMAEKPHVGMRLECAMNVPHFYIVQYLPVLDRHRMCPVPMKEIGRKGAAKLCRVPPAGCHAQGGLNCTGSRPSVRSM